MLKGRAEIKPHFIKAAAAFLHAGNKAAAAFKKCASISARCGRSSNNDREVTENKAALSTNKPRSYTCTYMRFLLCFFPPTPGRSQSAFFCPEVLRARNAGVTQVNKDKRPNCLLTTAVKFRADSGTKGSWEIGAMRNGGPKAVPRSPPGTWGSFTHHQGAVGLRRGGGPWLGLWRLDSSK